MSLFISSLNSGSNGNCYYVGSSEDAILIDAGLSCRETEKRLRRLGLDISRIRAVFISHEHKDHINGLPLLSTKHRIPVYITASTETESRLSLDQNLVQRFNNLKPISIGGLTITAFPKAHDAVDPYSFVVEMKGIRIGVFTDIGTVCEQLIHYFSQCHAAFLEANYDEGMLDRGSYPVHLKNRIRGGEGHLSNRQSLDLLESCKPDFMTHLLLSHLSQNNNCPDLVAKLFTAKAGHTKIIVASRFEETALYAINAKEENKYTLTSPPFRPARQSVTQLNLFA